MSDTEPVTIRLPLELKTKLEKLAASTQRSRSFLAAEAIAEYVEREGWQIRDVEQALIIADGDGAQWVDGGEVDAWLASWGTPDEKSAPCG